jgi:hypothetical protein
VASEDDAPDRAELVVAVALAGAVAGVDGPQGAAASATVATPRRGVDAAEGCSCVVVVGAADEGDVVTGLFWFTVFCIICPGIAYARDGWWGVAALLLGYLAGALLVLAVVSGVRAVMRDRAR